MLCTSIGSGSAFLTGLEIVIGEAIVEGFCAGGGERINESKFNGSNIISSSTSSSFGNDTISSSISGSFGIVSKSSLSEILIKH